MITVIVLFQLAPDTTREQAAAIFRQTAPLYRDIDGLVRKYYLFREGGQAGGVYLWTSREAAERAYGTEWRQRVMERYGAEPDITFFETPVIVDNSTGIVAD